jgi:predicted nucleic-acid-binding Zn-ribbon protein
MLRFFRQIRHRLLTDKKFSRYLLYAVGEILLVVIGILIALQVDNWNEYRKDRLDEKDFLTRLKVDLEIDNQYFKRRIQDAELKLSSYTNFARILNQQQRTFAEVDSLNKLFSEFFSSEMVTTQNSTFSEMLYSGKLELITDADLKFDLLFYYRRNEEISKHIAEYNLFTVDVLKILMEKVPKYFGAKSISESDSEFEKEFGYLNDPSSDQFHYISQSASAYGSKHYTSLEYFRELETLSHELIQTIENDIR